MRELERFLIELGCGDFETRIEFYGKGDPIEGLVTTANMTGEEIEHFFRDRNPTILFPGSSLTSYTSFILDNDLRIWLVCEKTARALSLDRMQVQDQPFCSLLARESQEHWAHIKAMLDREENVEDPVELSFALPNGLTRPVYCKVSTLYRNREKMRAITVLVNKPQPPKRKKKNRVSLHPADIKILQQVKRMVMQFPERKLPTLEVLARQYGTNEYKLKHGFKDLYGTTIFKLQRKERLRRAETLIAYTDLPFKSIARNIGYSLSHFYEAFKVEYGKSPGSLRKS